MKYIKGFLKGLIGLIAICVIALYITDYDYILKGVRVVYMTGHTTAYIDDYQHFENASIENGTAQPWPEHKAYNSVLATDKLNEVNETLGTVAFIVVKNDSIFLYYGKIENNKKSSKARQI